MSDTLEMLRELAELSEEDRNDAIIDFPKLLAEGVPEAFLAELVAVPESEQPALRAAATWFEDRRRYYERHLADYPIGRGPVEKLARAIQNGEIARQEARRQADTVEMAGLLSLVYVKALRMAALALFEERPTLTLDIATILLATTNHWPDAPEAWRWKVQVTVLAMDAAQFQLVQVPDGELYRWTCAQVHTIVDEARRRDDGPAVAWLLTCLGTLHLDPWIVGRSQDHYEASLRLWHGRLEEREGRDDAASILALLPAPAKALQTSERYLREAVALSEGARRGRALKALAQNLAWRRFAWKDGSDDAELIALATEALGLMDREDPQDRASIQTLNSILHALGGEMAGEGVREVVGTPLAKLVADLGRPMAFLWVTQVARQVKDATPEALFDWLSQARELLPFAPSDLDVVQFWLLQSRLICQKRCPDLPTLDSVDKLEQELEGLQRGPSDRPTEATRWLWLARATSALDLEAHGLAFFDRAVKGDPTLLANHLEAMIALRGVLHEGAGSVAYKAGARHAAADFYAGAMAAYDRLGCKSMALGALGKLDDVVRAEGGVRAILSFQGLASVIPGLETRLGPEAVLYTQSICRAGLAAMVENGAKAEDLARSLQIMKGARFALGCLASDIPARVAGLESVQDGNLARHSEVLQRELGAVDVNVELFPFEAAIDEDMLLSSALEPRARDDGDRAAERVINLQRTFTRRLNERLLAEADFVTEEHLMSAEDVRSRLDDRTVLLDLLLTTQQQGRLRLHIMLHTAQETRAVVLNGRDREDMGMAVDGVKLRGSASLVRTLRNALRIDSDRRAFPREAESPLKELFELIVEPIEPELRQFREQGKDHLCIVPNGALHFCPLHLLGRDGATLADEWTVTYLPNLRLLMREPRPARQRGRQAAVLGVSFSGASGHLEEAVSGARDIAQLYRVQPLVDEQVTRTTVLEALRTSRFVHLATHGRHNVAAPWFQTLYLHPGTDQHERRLLAHEVLGCDLRGLEVLSLSACETSLGRFDASDNLVGLPGGLFLAGVSTLVGTLWKVRPAPTQLFFLELHRGLSRGLPRYQAFGTAQKAVRAEYRNNYGAWGGFFMAGAWD